MSVLLILLATLQVGAEMANVTGLCGCLFFIWSYKYAHHLLLYANSLGKKTSCDNLLPIFNYNIFFVQRNINIKIKELWCSYSLIICLRDPQLQSRRSGAEDHHQRYSSPNIIINNKAVQINFANYRLTINFFVVFSILEYTLPLDTRLLE